MSSVLIFTANWNKSYRVLRYHKGFGLFMVVLLLLCSATRIFAQTAMAPSHGDSSSYSQPRQYLFSDSGGKKSELAPHGVTFSFFYVADLQPNPVGGVEQTQAGWGRIRGTMDVDFGKLREWNGLTLHATGLWQFGTDLGGKIGVIANPSGLVSAHATRLDPWRLQQAFFNNQLFAKVGQLAGLDFCGNQIYGASYVIEPLDYAFGNLFTNTFESFNPAGTPGVQVRVQATHNFYVTAAAISGNRNPYQRDTTGLSFVVKDSPDFLFEAGYTHRYDNPAASGWLRKVYPGTFKFGGAYNGGKFANPSGVRNGGNQPIAVSCGGASSRIPNAAVFGFRTQVNF